jgi:hypothetical protein
VRVKPRFVVAFVVWFAIGLISLVPGVTWLLAGLAAMTGRIHDESGDAP